jgi:serine/threonine protein kinase
MACGAVMTEPTQDLSDDEGRLDEAVAAYYQTLEQTGQPPATEEFLARYPDLRPELVSFLANKELFDQRASATTPPAGPTTPGLDTVSYFGDYRLEAEIARGGMGIVYRARQLSLQRPVALKMILAGRLASATEAQRFRAEAEAAANLDHPHIVPIYEVGEHNGRHYYSMKLLARPSRNQEAEENDRSPA